MPGRHKVEAQAVFTNADAVLEFLMKIRVGFTSGFETVDTFGVEDDETGILSRCRQLAENFDWEIAEARHRAGRSDRPVPAAEVRPLLRMVPRP